jgi:hypothetical protein
MEKPIVPYNKEIVNYQPVKTDSGDNDGAMDENQNNPVFDSLLLRWQNFIIITWGCLKIQI